MRIAELAPLWKTVPPQRYGGSELVVSNLTEALVAQGHDVTLFACGGSTTKAKFVPVIEKPMYDLTGGFFWNAVPPYDFLLYDELFKRLDEFDVIHNHLSFPPLVFSRLLKQPMFTTLHSSLPPDFQYLADRFKDNNFVAISNAQRTLAPHLNYVETIYHGIDTASYVQASAQYSAEHTSPRDYFLFLGTLSKNKGVDMVVRAAKATGQKLILAGEIREVDRPFLDQEVMPYIDGEQIKFLGEVDLAGKQKLFAGAKAFLFPIRWMEAFGLVVAEALAAGTPVIAFRNGSLPELLDDGVTGYLVDSEDEFQARMQQIDQIDRSACQRIAQERFDMAVMAEHYSQLFQRFI